MKSVSFRLHTIAAFEAVLFLVCNASAWADTYNPSNNTFAIPNISAGPARSSPVKPSNQTLPMRRVIVWAACMD